MSKHLILLACICGSLHAARGEEKRWAFSPPAQAPPPAVTQPNWVRNGIDAFVLAKLEAQGLRPAPAASRRTLIRRLSFDLIGLPPTPADVEAFLADRGPDAYERLADRLLADPRYGERWARFWLDLARYADTAGYEGDPDLPHAWRYRDYVIDSLNTDKPYDRFIKEQIAGDEFAEIMGAGDLPGIGPERVVALTFLRLAPFTEPRGDETRHEMLSEMTSTVGSVFLGLTVGCAKCHDHKYDRIPTKDFYRLKAFFSTVQIPPPAPGDSYQIGGPLPAAFYRPAERAWAKWLRARFTREIGESKDEFARFSKQLEEKIGHGGAGFGLQSSGEGLGNNYFFDRRRTNDGQLHVAVVNAEAGRWQFFTDGVTGGAPGRLAGRNQGQWFGDLPSPTHVSLGKHAAGTGQPKNAPHRGRFAEILVYDRPLTEKDRASLAAYVKAKYETAGAGNAAGLPRAGLRFWLDASDLDADPATPNPARGASVAAWADKIGGLRLTQDETALQPTLDVLGSAQAPAVRFDDDFLVAAAAGAAFLTDQQGALVVVFSATHSDEGYGFEVGGDGAFISTVIYPDAPGQGSLADIVGDRTNPALTQAERDRYRFLATRERFLKQRLARLRPVAMSLRHSYGPPYEPGVPTSRVMIRGEYDNPGEVVEPGFLSCITGDGAPAAIRLDPFKRWPTRSRRMALARWIASPDNPLTARVMVNRLWQGHFGRGIVATPSDFGALSGGPSHPALLDWLAHRFVAARWSLKAMHRLMVTSSAYRQSSRHANPRAAQADPDNLLLWRFRRRRLEAEAIRDAVLAVSGRLTAELGGLPIFPPLPGDLAERVKYGNSKWDTDTGPQGRKRSVYIYQQRTLTMPLMQAFDALVCDSSRPLRRSSLTPLQALAMFNGAFVTEEARQFAARVRTEAGEGISRRIRRAYQLALGRAPSAAEATRFRAFVESHESPSKGLVGLCRVLLNCNEFLYLE